MEKLHGFARVLTVELSVFREGDFSRSSTMFSRRYDDDVIWWTYDDVTSRRYDDVSCRRCWERLYFDDIFVNGTTSWRICFWETAGQKPWPGLTLATVTQLEIRIYINSESTWHHDDKIFSRRKDLQELQLTSVRWGVWRKEEGVDSPPLPPNTTCVTCVVIRMVKNSQHLIFIA